MISSGNGELSRQDDQLTLNDGRRLGYAEFGDPNGRPLIYLHGFPGSRLAAGVLDQAARLRGVRVVAPDRPGIGLSSPQPGRTLLDHAKDVRSLTERLAIRRFAVLGESGGGPYALACAHELRQEITSVGVVGSLGPVTGPGATLAIATKERIGYLLAARMPLLAGRALLPIGWWARRRPRQFLRLVRWQLEQVDRDALRGPLGDLVAADFAEAFRHGSRGVAQDLAILFRPWPFQADDITVPVIVVHGELDRTVSVAVAQNLAARIPNARLHLCNDDGHFSLLGRHGQQVLDELLRSRLP